MTSTRHANDDREMEIIDAYLEHLRRNRCTDKTIDRRSEILYRLNRQLPHGIGCVSTEDLAAWLYRPGLSQNTWATYYHALKSFYRWASNPRDPWLNDDPTVDLEHVSRPKGIARPITDEQLQFILTHAIEPYRTWSVLACYQGFRCIEISRADRKDFTQQYTYVQEGKGGHPRVHDTDPTVWATVKDLPPGPIARLADGSRATPDQVSVRSALYFQRRLGLEKVSLHRLRHWLGVTVQREYRDIRVTQAVLGHASLTSTQIYTMATEQQQRAARSTLPRFPSAG